MAFFKLGTIGILLAAGISLQSVPLGTPPPTGGGTEGLTHTLTIEYVDSNGIKQTVTSTPASPASITIPLGTPIWIDATNSTSVETNADTVLESWLNTRHYFNFGEALSGTWSLTGGDKNVISGSGIAGYVYTTTGTKQLTAWFKDTNNRLSFFDTGVTVTALSAGTDISVGGSWPTFASNTVYNLAAGTDHSAKGAINLNGLHNVVIRKTGAGADPIVSAVNWHTVNVSNTAQSRTRGCRLIGIDVGSVSESSVGSLYCAVIDGRCRRYETSADQYYWENQASTQTEKNNICRPRGITLWNCGEINSNSSNYVLIFTAKNFTARNVDFRKTTGDAGQHVFRFWGEGLDLRHNRFRSSVATMSFNKITGADNGSTFNAWPSDDTLGVWNGALYLPVCRKIVLANNVYGASGSTLPSGQDVEICPENDTTDPDQAIEMAALENNVWQQASTSGADAWFSGRYIYYYNNKVNLGAGGEISYSPNARLNRTPPGWNGPYGTTVKPTITP